MAHLNKKELRKFKHAGKGVKISSKASFYNPSNISIGDYTRIDDFCVISAGQGGIDIGKHVHIAVFAALIGDGKISVGDFAGISSRATIYSSNDDYSGNYMTGPTVDKKFTNVKSSVVNIGKHSVIGSGSVILPGVTIGDGACTGALSFIKEDCEPFYIY